MIKIFLRQKIDLAKHGQLMDTPQPAGEIFTPDNRTNLYYINDLYARVAEYVSYKMDKLHEIQVNITSGVWGGTYLIADERGKSLRRLWRLYCLVNLPQGTPLDKHENLEKLVEVYTKAFVDVFRPCGLDLQLKMWGGRLPYSNKIRPTITMHLEDKNDIVRWLRPIIVWNSATWEQSIIYDSVRLVKELKVNLNYDKGPTLTDAQEIKYLLQDVIITYHTLEGAHDPDFIEHAQPIIDDMKQTFLKGLFEEEEIKALYEKVLNNALVYGYEQTLQEHYGKHGLDVRKVEDWPVQKINFVPEGLQETLIPPIQNLFATFRSNLENGSGSK